LLPYFPIWFLFIGFHRLTLRHLILNLQLMVKRFLTHYCALCLGCENYFKSPKNCKLKEQPSHITFISVINTVSSAQQTAFVSKLPNFHLIYFSLYPLNLFKVSPSHTPS
jgi:hypothetical protein